MRKQWNGKVSWIPMLITGGLVSHACIRDQGGRSNLKLTVGILDPWHMIDY